MALKGLDIFKLTPKKNCKECGCPTCMAFSMKVAAGALSVDKCPHMSPDALAALTQAAEPLMRTVELGEGKGAVKLGGETVLFRHEKTLVNRNRFAVTLSSDDADIEAKLKELLAVDYTRIGEREYVECLFLEYAGNGADAYIRLIERVKDLGRVLVLDCPEPEVAKAALQICGGQKPLLNGVDAGNLEAMAEIAAANNVALGVTGGDVSRLYDNIRALEAQGIRNLVLDATGADTQSTFRNAVQIRRANLKDGERTFGYPILVNTARLAPGNLHLQTALASAFVLRYGAIIVMERMRYAEALALYGLRQNIYTDPQKPMKVEPGIYPINGANPDSPCALTVDFALTYFLVAGELERSRCPVNLLIADAGGMSVLTAWAAGKFSAGTIRAFFDAAQIEDKLRSRTLIIPGKVAVMKVEIEQKLPGWQVVVGPMEAVQLVRFMRERAMARSQD